MEELQTTETLDREILEDARKKAQRILKTADDTLAAQTLEWEKKTRQAVDTIRGVYEEREKKTGGEILARLPLDKRRLRSETAEGLLLNAMDGFLRSLTREERLSVLEAELRARLEASAGGEESTREIPEEGGNGGLSPASSRGLVFSGLDISEARLVLEKALAALPQTQRVFSASIGDWDFKEVPASGEFPSLVINTREMKISASVEGAAAALLKDKRAELARALLGGGVLND